MMDRSGQDEFARFTFLYVLHVFFTVMFRVVQSFRAELISHFMMLMKSHLGMMLFVNLHQQVMQLFLRIIELTQMKNGKSFIKKRIDDLMFLFNRFWVGDDNNH